VSSLLRGATLPGVSGLLAVGSNPRVSGTLWRAGERLGEHGVGTGVHLQAIARALRPLERRGAREAFLHTLRSVIDVRGQRVSATDRLYLLDDMPTLIVWGERDRTIPISHGRLAHAAVPHSRFVTLPEAAHFPHLEDPDGLAAALAEFIATTEPGRTEDADWADMIAPRSHRARMQ
jgi:pimeloyl-ACP methyl ester carboxylesterase